MNARSDAIAPARKISPGRILFVDDDEAMSAWIRDQLRRSRVSAEVTATGTGRNAFNLLNDREFDLCVMEYALPDMTGVQLCALLRHMGFRIPLIFLSAMNRPIDRQKAIDAGASEYLCKPDDLGRVAGRISSHLTISRLAFGLDTAGSAIPRAA